MRKRFSNSLFLITCAIFMAIFFSCLNNKSVKKENASENILQEKIENIIMNNDKNINCDDLIIKLKADVPKQQVMITVYNNSSHAASPLSHYSLDYNVGNEWKELSFNAAFEDLFITIEPQDSLVNSLPFNIINESLLPGTYRIKQPVQLYQIRFDMVKNRNILETISKCELIGYFTINE